MAAVLLGGLGDLAYETSFILRSTHFDTCFTRRATAPPPPSRRPWFGTAGRGAPEGEEPLDIGAFSVVFWYQEKCEYGVAPLPGYGLRARVLTAHRINHPSKK